MYLPAALHVLPERMFRAISLWQVPADMRMHTALFVSPTPSPLYAAESATIPARQHATETTWMNPWVSATSSVLSQTRLSKTACLLWKKKRKSNGKKIAVIGAGPSGLSCAYYLQLSGYSVEVFESESVAGGVLAYGIPEYRLPKAVLNRDIQAIEATGVQIHLNTTVGEDVSFDELYKKFHAVYVSTGTQLSRKANIPGEDMPGVYHGLDFLKAVNLGKPVEIGKKVAVIGGGNTAIDAARTARRLGAEVTIVYRRQRNDMPCEERELLEAFEEGVRVLDLAAPVEVVGEGKVQASSACAWFPV